MQIEALAYFDEADDDSLLSMATQAAGSWPRAISLLSRIDGVDAPCSAAHAGEKGFGGADCWARVLSRSGRDVRLMPPACVTSDVKRGKTDKVRCPGVTDAGQSSRRSGSG